MANKKKPVPANKKAAAKKVASSGSTNKAPSKAAAKKATSPMSTKKGPSKKAAAKKSAPKKFAPKKAAPKKAAAVSRNVAPLPGSRKSDKSFATMSDGLSENLQFFEVHKIFGSQYAQALTDVTTTYRAWCSREERFLQDHWTDEATADGVADRHAAEHLHPTTVMIKRRNH